VNAVIKPEKTLLKLDLGSGPNPRDGFTGVDAITFGKDNILKHDLRVTPWPFEDNSVSEANCSHFLEHLTNLNDKWERVRFFNELYRVLVPGEYNAAGAPVAGFCRIVIPHWCSNRYYGDPTHKEPFGEMAICYLDPTWRKANAPHADSEFNSDGYNCHFACTYDYTLHQDMAGRNAEYVRMAVTFWKEAVQDLVIHAVKVVAKTP
jgi:hypothetical protein